MLKRTSSEFGKIFLLEFTRQLIRNSSTAAFSIIETEVEGERKEKENKIKEMLNKKQTKQFTKELEEELFPTRKLGGMQRKNIVQIPRVLRIPKPRLPRNLQYLMPIPTRTEIDLGELNPLVKNSLVDSIECHGPNENLTVRGRKGTKVVDLNLTEEQIEEIIQTFSSAAKIPYEEGILDMAYGTLELSAIVSQEVGSKFILTRIKPPMQQIPQMQQRIF